MDQDSLVFFPLEKWHDLQSAFKQDWPRGVSGYWALATQRQWFERGVQHDFKVYCPFGDVKNGMVVMNKKNSFNEIIIQCPNDDTSNLEEALRKTKRIDWNRKITIPFPPKHIIKCIHEIQKDINVNVTLDDHANEMFILNKESPAYENVCLPFGVVFELLTEKDIDLVDSSWINRYDSSSWYFKLLAKAQSGYGLYANNELACWVFINEVGALTHLFTVENHRKKGYAEMLLQLVCNKRLKENKDSFAYCRVGNTNAFNLYTKLGFKKCHPVIWCELTPNS